VVKKTTGEINIPLAKQKLGKNEKVAPCVDANLGKPAITKFVCQKTYQNHSLLKLHPITGRTHQLRVHCKEIGHPIINTSNMVASKPSNRKLPTHFACILGKLSSKTITNKKILPSPRHFQQNGTSLSKKTLRYSHFCKKDSKPISVQNSPFLEGVDFFISDSLWKKTKVVLGDTAQCYFVSHTFPRTATDTTPSTFGRHPFYKKGNFDRELYQISSAKIR
jgi:hypothetical protein